MPFLRTLRPVAGLLLFLSLASWTHAAGASDLNDEIMLASPFYLPVKDGVPPCRGMPGPGIGRMPPLGAQAFMPPFLPPWLVLSGAQQDKVFAIVYPDEPKLRAWAKTIRNSMTTLHALAMSDQFDLAKAKSAVAENARAQAGMALLHARIEHRVYAVLSPAQRQQLEAGSGRCTDGGMAGVRGD